MSIKYSFLTESEIELQEGCNIKIFGSLGLALSLLFGCPVTKEAAARYGVYLEKNPRLYQLVLSDFKHKGFVTDQTKKQIFDGFKKSKELTSSKFSNPLLKYQKLNKALTSGSIEDSVKVGVNSVN